MNNCPNCDQEIDQTQGQVCTNCGTPLEETTETGSEETTESGSVESAED
jgi:predicted amidophosphoribosyltransferase